MNNEDPQKIYVSANEIIPGLWLGNEAASQSLDFLQEKDISIVVNCTKHIPCTYQNNIKYYRIPVNDPGPVTVPHQEDNVQMLKYLPVIVESISKELGNNKNILVHCHAGMMRSATVVLCYLMTNEYYNKDKKHMLKTSLKHILTKRPIVFNYGVYSSFKYAISEYMRNI